MELAWKHIAERRIQEAIDDGKFDNLPGKGKPLNLEEDLSTPPHLRIANRILKNAGVLPDWIQVDQEIDRERDSLAKSWERLTKEYARRKTRTVAAPGTVIGDPEKRKKDFGLWLARERATYHQAMRRVNTDITRLLLMAPSVPRVHTPYKIAEEMSKFDEAFPSLPGVDVAAPAEPEQADPLKEAARAAYAERLKRRGGP